MNVDPTTELGYRLGLAERERDELRGRLNTVLGEMWERIDDARRERDRYRDRLDEALAEVRRLAREKGVPSLMVKVRAFDPDAEETGRLPIVRYFGPSHAHNARNVAAQLRARGKRVEVLTAPLGRWQEVDW